MSDTLLPSPYSTRTSVRGRVIMAGALLWFVAELLFVFLGWSEADSGPKSGLVEVGSTLLLVIPQVCYLIGLPGLWEAGAVRTKWPVRLAQAAVFMYTLPFLAAVVTLTGLSGAGKNPLTFLLPLGLLLIAVSMTAVGIAVRRAGVWRDWRRFTPFVVGLFPVGLMLPLAAIYGKPDYVLVAIWGLTWFGLGLALYRSNQRA